jgi:hypothetical protein
MELVSIGSSTHTRVDSAAKHIRQCKIHERLMLLWHGTHGPEAMHRQKNMYATMKDDLVLNVNESLNVGFAPTDAYPSVLSNFTSLHDKTKELIGRWYAKSTPAAFFAYQKQITENELEDPKFKAETQVKSLPFFRAQGYALGRAEATMRSGDTVFSVLIGGQMTVLNGHFAMRPGQLVQWYFDFEDKMFDEDGRRLSKPLKDNRKLNALGKRANEETNAESTCFARPKPYVPNENGSDHYGDKIRIFAKCIAGGAAYHKVDIMLMTQTL